MLGMLSRNWWMLLVRGFAAILLGIAAIIAPPATIAAFATVFAAYLFVDGFFLIVTAITRTSYSRWWLTLLEGVLGIIAGIAAFLFPGAVVATFILIAAAWAIISGAFQIVNAIELRRQIDNEWWMILGGAISILWGGLLIARPGESLLALLWLFAVAAILFGALLVLLAFRVRGMRGTQAAA